MLAGPGGRGARRRRALGPCPPRYRWRGRDRGRSATLAMLRRRHELRAVLKNYDQPRRLFVVLDLAAGSIAEVSVALFRGERERAKRVADAWWWNWRHRRSLRLARKALASVRQRPDRVVARLLSRGDRRSALEANPIVPIVPVGPVGLGREGGRAAVQERRGSRTCAYSFEPEQARRPGQSRLGGARPNRRGRFRDPQSIDGAPASGGSATALPVGAELAP